MSFINPDFQTESVLPFISRSFEGNDGIESFSVNKYSKMLKIYIKSRRKLEVITISVGGNAN